MMPGMATQSLHLRRGQDGYYRTNWYDEAGKRHGRCFGKDRHAARHEFSLFHARWRADPAVRNPDRAQPMTIRDGWERYYHWAQAYYVRPDGTPTQEATAMAAACAKLIELYGDLPAREFSPRALRHLQYVMAGEVCRNEINKRSRRIRSVFKWLAAEELIPAGTWHALQTVRAVDQGRPIIDPLDERAAPRVPRESPPVGPVPDKHVWAVIEHAPPTIAAMVELAYYTGMRPGELCMLRAVDVDMGGRIWIYRPTQHKTRHLNHQRAICIGPKGQAVLRRVMPQQLQAYVFSPRRAMAERYAARKTHRRRPALPPRTERRISDRYVPAQFAKAIKYICAAHDIPAWHPNQLRHNAATRIRREYGLEAAQVVLGHARADVTQVYAERDMARAIQVMEEAG